VHVKLTYPRARSYNKIAGKYTRKLVTLVKKKRPSSYPRFHPHRGKGKKKKKEKDTLVIMAFGSIFTPKAQPEHRIKNSKFIASQEALLQGQGSLAHCLELRDPEHRPVQQLEQRLGPLDHNPEMKE